MDFSALRGCHQPIHQVPKRSSLSSASSSKVRFCAGFFIVPAGSRLFWLGMLSLLLTWPSTYRVGAVTFAFNGFHESDVYMVNDSPWTFQSNTSCFYFDPPEASGYKSVAGRFLYPDLVQMKDPVTKQVKSFSTSFIYKIQIRPGYYSSFAMSKGPGMSFIVVPNNVTVGAASDYMGLLTTDTSTSAKNYESDNHTLGVELDTFMNPEFHDPNGHHIGVNLASMNSTFIVDPALPLASVVQDLYIQIWIDYLEAGSRMDISIALYGLGKPVMPQGFHTGLDLSLLLENMYIGFSTAKGIQSDNVPHVYAWSFSNDGIPAPPIAIGLDATSASPPADGPIVAHLEVPPSVSHISSPSPSGTPPPISMANPPSPNHGAPGPTPIAKKKKILTSKAIVGIIIATSILLSCLIQLAISFLPYRCRIFQHVFHIFISYEGGSNGHGKKFAISLSERMKSNLKSHIKIFFDQPHGEEGISFATTIMKKLAKFDVGIVVVTKEYFEKKWPMIELLAFVEAQNNDSKNRIHILPLFYGLTPEELNVHLNVGTWEGSWKEMSRGPHPIQVKECREAVRWLCNARSVEYPDIKRDNFDKEYIETICHTIDKILCKKRSFASNLPWATTTVFKRATTMTCINIEKKKRRANHSTRKEIGVMLYINKLLRLLFAFSGLLIIFLSVILDNYFNDKPIRFTAFAILAPIMIFLGFLASGWFPWIPLRFIALVKRFGFLQQVVPCSPWHDNVVINFCGEICTLELLEQDEGRMLLEFPMSVQNFLHGERFPPQRTTHSMYSHSTLDSEIEDYEVTTSPLEIQGQDVDEVSRLNPQNQDIKTSNVPNQAFMSKILARPHIVMATDQVPSPNLQETPSQDEDVVVVIDHSPLFYVLGGEQVPTLEFEGPKINGFPLKVQAFKNMSTRDFIFGLSCTFRNKKTRRMNLTTERLSYLVQNMCQWVETPHPIVIDESRGILHCMAIQDILWAFTKGVYKFNSVAVEHRYLAGMEKDGSIVFLSLTLITLMMGIIPLVWDKKSYWFLLFLIVLVVYVLKTKYIPYYFRSLFCPIYIKYKDFRTLYKSKSSFIWCNEFRKKKITNPNCFWINQEYANKLSDVDSCFDTGELVILPGNPFRGKNFKISCQGWPEHDPKKQHDYQLEVDFDTFNPSDTCYTSVTLSFYEDGDLLGTRKYKLVEIQRLQLIEKLFYCYSNPSFGGYIETIRPCSWSQSYLGNCHRFLDICDKIITDSTMPIPWEATTKLDSEFIIGVPF